MHIDLLALLQFEQSLCTTSAVIGSLSRGCSSAKAGRDLMAWEPHFDIDPELSCTSHPSPDVSVDSEHAALGCATPAAPSHEPRHRAP